MVVYLNCRDWRAWSLSHRVCSKVFTTLVTFMLAGVAFLVMESSSYLAYLVFLLAGISLSSIGQAREVVSGISLSSIGQTREAVAVVDAERAGMAGEIMKAS